ncbi:MAG: LuxR C-terminal-related transcriptional regulator [Kluyvera sp.]|uniref:LuxR C-terminal-related transcriptional regulator n=1 Tax=Kluyvera sp. TaxID=1538228 RepID=UPI003F31AEBD
MLTYNLVESQFNQVNTVCRIMVIDRTSIVSFAIRKLLEQFPYMNVVGQCCDRYNVMTLLKKCNPTLIIIDPDRPYLDGIKLIKQLKRHNSQLKFIVYMHESSHLNLKELISLNVQGIALKNSDISSLQSAIHTVCRGYTFMDKALSPHTSSEQPVIDIRSLTDTFVLPQVSPREKQILGLIFQGLKNKEIAEKLNISIKTVESHRLNMMKKLDAHSIVDLMKWAIRLNIN